MSKSNNVGLIVDAPYLYNAKTVLGANVDYTALYRKVSGFGELVHAHVHAQEIPGQAKFLTALTKIGYTVHTRNEANQARWWVHNMAESIIAIAPTVGRLVAAVGDGRLAPILEFAEATWGCEITVIGFREHCSDDILEFADDGFIQLDESIAYVTRTAAPANSG